VSQTANNDLVVGQLRRQNLLGSEAVYRVCDFSHQDVWVEVVRAPGLSPGQRFKFAREAVIAMDVSDDARPRAAR
jgi:hypothetical protein